MTFVHKRLKIVNLQKEFFFTEDTCKIFVEFIFKSADYLYLDLVFPHTKLIVTLLHFENVLLTKTKLFLNFAINENVSNIYKGINLCKSYFFGQHKTDIQMKFVYSKKRL